MMPALIIGFVIFGIAGWIWRLNLALNHPEKEERYQKLFKDIQKEQGEVLEKGIGIARKGIAFGLKMRRRWK
jgi:hypothetical protein